MCVLTHRDHDNLHKLILSYHVDPWDWNQVTSLEKQELFTHGAISLAQDTTYL